MSGEATNVTPGQFYTFKFPTLPTEYTIPAGHQLGVVVVANASPGVAGTRGAVVTVDTKASKVTLPMTDAATTVDASGAFAPDTTAPTFADQATVVQNTTDLTGATVTYTPPVATDTQDTAPTVSCTPASGTKFAIGTTHVTCKATDANGNAATETFDVVVQYVNQTDGSAGGTVPATLALTLGTPAAFGAFTPGVGADYTASMTANVISTAGDASLSVADPSATATGHLVNGAFSLAQAVQAKAGAGAFADVGGSAAPTLLMSWTAPVSNDAPTVTFKQSIGANEPLRTGSYSKTLTFTLSTTTP